MPVATKSRAMSTLSTGAAYKAAWADGGKKIYHSSPPSVISTAPSRAGRVDRNSIKACNLASLMAKAACR